jgi:F0F1-type ATP synthase assembly protein I
VASQNPSPRKNPGGFARQMALAMELPFLIAGGALVGGLFGFLLDRWLHTKPYLMILLGALGFFAAVRDMLRRLQKNDPDAPPNSRS